MDRGLLKATGQLAAAAMAVAALLLCACTRPASGPPDSARTEACVDSMSAQIGELTAAFRFDRAVELSDAMLDSTASCPESASRLKALAYAGQTYMMSDRYDKAGPVLEEGIALWRRLRDSGTFAGDYLPVYVLYNGLSIYAITCEMNYEKAIAILTEGISMAELQGRSGDYSILCFNLVFTYYLRGDAEGLPVALDLYSRGKAGSSDQMLFLGAYSAALMYFTGGDYASAERYVLEALDSPYLSMSPMGVHNLYAMVLAEKGEREQARAQYEKAWSYRDIETATTVSNVCLSYGSFLLDCGEPAAAAELFTQGLRLNDDINNNVFTYKLYRGLSRACQQLGRWQDALEYYQKYDQQADSIFSIKRERATAALVLQYETARHEAQLQKMKSIMQMIAVASAAALVILAVLWTMYRHKNRMYTSIVRQYREALRKEKTLEDRIASLTQAQQGDTALSPGKGDELFASIERLMQQERLYRQQNITRDKLAEIVGTNRTYVSRIINERTGKTFNQYISSYRISEALQILTDPSSKVQMKTIAIESGFCSFSTFAKQFKDEVGMTPSKYREKVIELCEYDNSRINDAETSN